MKKMTTINYQPRIPVLFVEDDEKIASSLITELTKRNIFVHAVKNFSDAVDAIKKCEANIALLDGNFPSKKGGKGAPNFIPLFEKIKKINQKIEVIPWSNSTHVHEYCKKNNLPSYSKSPLTRERFKLKGRRYIKTKTIEAAEMAEMIEEKLIQKIGYDKFIKHTKLEEYYKEPATVLGLFMATDMRTAMFKDTAGLNYGAMLTEFEDGVCDILIDPKHDGRIAKKIYHKILNENYYPVIWRSVKDRAKKLLAFARKLKTSPYAKLSNEKLAKLYLEFCRRFMEMRTFSSLPTAMEHRTNIWTEKLESILRKKTADAEEANKALSLLTTPEKDSYLKEYEMEAATLGLKNSRGKNIKEEIDALAKKYAWIQYTFQGIPITARDVEKKIASIGKKENDFRKIIEDHRKELIELKKNKAETARKLKLSKREKGLFDIGAGIVFIKFFRKGVFAESYCSMEFLLAEIGRRISCGRQAVNMLPQEVLAALRLGTFPKKLLDLRMKASILFHSSGTTYAIGKSPKNTYKRKVAVNSETKKLSGQTAYPGVARGKVRLVNLVEDMKNFQEGNIMVSRSTHPDLFLVMQKAAAIVTDIGGLTAHAAIVARELKKPCVIGTKNASTVLKNGDQVEVDADKGIVKILK